MKTAQRRVIKIVRLLERCYGVPRQRRVPTPATDMLVGTLLSQNTNDRNSYRAYAALRIKYPTWDMVERTTAAGIASAIRVGGMANLKSRRIKSLLRSIRRDFGSLDLGVLRQEKNDQEAMRALTTYHGIGVKTAACVLLFSFRREVLPVDTHIHRICNRLGLIRAKTPEKTFEAMKHLVPKKKSYSLHTNLIRFGRTVCLARRPRCHGCPLRAECRYASKTPDSSARPSDQRSPKIDFMLLDNL